MTILPESFNDLVLLNTKCERKRGSSSSSEVREEKSSASQGDNELTDEQDEVLKEPDIAQELSQYFTIPLYVYECYLPNILDILINPWTFQLPEDIFEDLTFSETDKDESFSSIMFKIPSFEKDITPGCDEATMYMKWMRIAHERRLTESSNSENEATLKQQCSMLTDMYYSCFVNGE